MSENAIVVENLSKRYLIGHRLSSGGNYKYTALRDVVGREVGNFVRKATDVIRGRQVVQGDEVEDFWVLKDVSFEVKQGEVLGIIGRNGAGKSTLLKILSRITEPTKGRVVLRGRVSSLLEVGTGFHPELTGRENIFLNGAVLGMTQREIRSKFDEIVAFAEVEKFLDTPVKHYSSGMYVRLAFAVAAHLEPEILVVDEVLAVGDAEFQKKCLGKMREVSRNGGRTVLFVSHNMESIRRLCARAALFEQGSIVAVSDVMSITTNYLTRALETIATTKWSRSPSWTPDNGAGILAIEICDELNVPKATFLFGQELNIQLTLRNASDSEMRCIAGVEILTADGHSLLSSHSNDMGEVGALPVNDTILRCKIAPNPLMPGKYVIRVGLLDYAQSLLDFVEPDLVLQISDVSNNVSGLSVKRPGTLALPFCWREIQS